MTTEEKFWSNVNKDGPTMPHMATPCWVWCGSCTDGYGNFYIEGKTQRCNRLSYRFTYGKIPKGKFICHKCDNPPCVRPDHLYAGSGSDNSQDIKNRGRSNYSRLSDEIIVEIRKHYSTGNYSMAELATIYSISRNRLYGIVSGQSYKEIDGPIIKRKNVLKGERNSQAVLTENQVRELKSLPPATFTARQLSDRYKVDPEVIRIIALNNSWSHIEGKLVLKRDIKQQDGSLNHMAILNEDQVREIKRKLREGVTGKELCKEYGVAPMTISSIKTGRSWKHINE